MKFFLNYHWPSWFWPRFSGQRHRHQCHPGQAGADTEGGIPDGASNRHRLRYLLEQQDAENTLQEGEDVFQDLQQLEQWLER